MEDPQDRRHPRPAQEIRKIQRNVHEEYVERAAHEDDLVGDGVARQLFVANEDLTRQEDGRAQRPLRREELRRELDHRGRLHDQGEHTEKVRDV